MSSKKNTFFIVPKTFYPKTIIHQHMFVNQFFEEYQKII